MKNICSWCKEPLKSFCVDTDDGYMHVMCKVAELNPDATDDELWDLIDPPGSPMPLVRKPWPKPRRRVRDIENEKNKRRIKKNAF